MNSISKTGKLIDKFSKFFAFLPNKINFKLFVFFRKTEGKKGLILRGALVKSLVKECGVNVLIFPNVFLAHTDNIRLGSNISIHPMTYIDGAGGLNIGDDVSIAHGVTIMTTEHKYTNKEVPIREQGFIFEEINIGSNVWIGAKATILAGTNISNGTIVGANSVVNKNFEPDSIIAGCPARLIKNRFE